MAFSKQKICVPWGPRQFSESGGKFTRKYVRTPSSLRKSSCSIQWVHWQSHQDSLLSKYLHGCGTSMEVHYRRTGSPSDAESHWTTTQASSSLRGTLSFRICTDRAWRETERRTLCWSF